MITGIAPRCNEETKRLSKQARQYFIDCEKKLQEASKAQLTAVFSMLLCMA